MMFVVSEIHPFLDGNGRIARVMMNAELVKGGQSKIIIPTVYRDDYLGALRKLTRQGNPEVYIRMLSRTHEFSDTIASESLDEMQLLLERSNAFIEHTEGNLQIINQ
jgi:Fic family protein